jgi:hypothetical protein
MLLKGMLLELDNGEILDLIHSPASLKKKVEEALILLE